MNSRQQKTPVIADQGCLLNFRAIGKPWQAPVALRITATALEVTRYEFLARE